MWHRVGLTALGFLLAVTALRSDAVPIGHKSNSARSAALRLPALFEENVGQFGEPARFVARSRSGDLYLRPDHAEVRLPVRGCPAKSAGVKLKLLGADPNAPMRGEKRASARIDYLDSNDPNEWKTDVPAFEQVRVAQAYPGIDLVYYGKGAKDLEYDFEVSPGADPSLVRFSVTGAEKVRLTEDGALDLQTPAGNIRHERPVAYQPGADGNTSVDASYQIASDGSIGFQLADHDPSRALVIDPILSYSTYLGGSSDDYASDPVIGADGLLYMMATTNSTNFPKTASTTEKSILTVIDTSKSGKAALVYSAHLGPKGASGQVAVDASGLIYFYGSTVDPTLPVSHGFQAWQSNFKDPSYLMVLDRRLSGASALKYSTYLGASSYVIPYGLKVDDSGKAYLLSMTFARNMPVTPDAMQGPPSWELQLTHLCVVDTVADGSNSLRYASYFGGSDYTVASKMELDTSGKVYLSGDTNAYDLPVRNGYQMAHAPNTYDRNDPFYGSDTFFSVIDTTKAGASGLIYSTYLGGDYGEVPTAMAIDDAGRVYIAVAACGEDLPIVSGISAIPSDAQIVPYVAVIDPAKSGVESLRYGGYFGDGNGMIPRSVTWLGAGEILVSSADPYPAFTPKFAFQPTLVGGGDIALMRIDTEQSGNSSLLFASYLGGSKFDGFVTWACKDHAGMPILVGETQSPDFPTTATRIQSYQGATDIFICKLDFRMPAQPLNVSAQASNSVRRIDLNWTDNSPNNTGYEIQRRAGTGTWSKVATVGDVTSWYQAGSSLTAGVTYSYQIRSINSFGFSNWTGPASATVPLPPVAPTSLSATPGIGPLRVILNWDDRATTETSYGVFRASDGVRFNRIRLLPADATSWTDTGVTPGTTYHYKVAATNDFGMTYSEPQMATLDSLPPAPSNLIATAGASPVRIDVRWTDNSTDETSFTLFRSIDGVKWQFYRSLPINTTSAVDSNVTGGKTHWYRVQAVKSGVGNSPYSNIASATP